MRPAPFPPAAPAAPGARGREGRARAADPLGNGLALLAACLGLALLLACSGEEPGGAGALPAVVRAPLPEDPDTARLVAEAREAIVAAPESAEAWGTLGQVHQANYMLGPALECYRRAAELDPRNARWVHLEAVVQSDLGEHDGAIAGFRRARELDPGYAPIQWRLGAALFETGRTQEAEEAFRLALQIAPDSLEALTGLARIGLRRRDPDAAIRELRRALELRPRNRYVHSLLAGALRQKGSWDEARRAAELGANAEPPLLDPWVGEIAPYRADSHFFRWKAAAKAFEEGDYETALPALQALVDERPEQQSTVQLLAKTYAALGRREKAFESFERCLELEPDNREALMSFAELLVESDDVERALALTDRAIENNPTYGRAHHFRARLLKALGRFSEALDAFRSSLRLDARNLQTRVSIGYLELELYRWKDAEQTFEEALESGLDNGDVWAGLARARLELGELAAAEDALERAAADPPSDTSLFERLRRELARERRKSSGGGL